MEKKQEKRPRIVYPNDILPDQNSLSEMSNSEEVQEFRRLFGLEQDPT